MAGLVTYRSKTYINPMTCETICSGPCIDAKRAKYTNGKIIIMINSNIPAYSKECYDIISM